MSSGGDTMASPLERTQESPQVLTSGVPSGAPSAFRGRGRTPSGRERTRCRGLEQSEDRGRPRTAMRRRPIESRSPSICGSDGKSVARQVSVRAVRNCKYAVSSLRDADVREPFTVRRHRRSQRFRRGWNAAARSREAGQERRAARQASPAAKPQGSATRPRQPTRRGFRAARSARILPRGGQRNARSSDGWNDRGIRWQPVS